MVREATKQYLLDIIGCSIYDAYIPWDMPAALAMAECQGASGCDVVHTVAVGYE